MLPRELASSRIAGEWAKVLPGLGFEDVMRAGLMRSMIQNTVLTLSVAEGPCALVAGSCWHAHPCAEGSVVPSPDRMKTFR